MTQICAAGVDVSRDFFDVGLAPSGRVFRTANGQKGIEAVVSRLRREGASRVILESIGGYAARLVRALADAGFEVGVIDPKRIRALRIAEGKRAKTDALDARLIARFALIMQDAARPVPSPKAFEIRALSTRRRQLVEMIAMEKVRLKQTLDEALRAARGRRCGRDDAVGRGGLRAGARRCWGWIGRLGWVAGVSLPAGGVQAADGAGEGIGAAFGAKAPVMIAVAPAELEPARAVAAGFGLAQQAVEIAAQNLQRVGRHDRAGRPVRLRMQLRDCRRSRLWGGHIRLLKTHTNEKADRYTKSAPARVRRSEAGLAFPARDDGREPP